MVEHKRMHSKVRYGSRLCKNLEAGLGSGTVPADAYGAAL